MQKAGLWGMAAGMGLAALVMWETHEPTPHQPKREVTDRNSIFSDHEYGIVGELLSTRENKNVTEDETVSEQEEPDIPKVGRTKGFMPDGMPSVSVSPF